MGEQTQTTRRRRKLSQSQAVIIAAMITAFATIVVGIMAGFRLPDTAKLEVYEFSVNQQEFPFERSPVELHEGDTVEIIVPGANSIVLDCGTGETTVIGMVSHQDQRFTVLPTANLCALIGRIGSESAPYFPVGAYTKFVAPMDGILYLGVNDAPPDKCSHQDCFSGNTGSIFVNVNVIR